MLAFPGMLLAAASKAGMKLPPEDVDVDKVDLDTLAPDYPHFFVFCMLQLGVPVTWGNHWYNAELIADIPEDKLITMTASDFYAMGFSP